MIEWVLKLSEQERWFYGIIIGIISIIIGHWISQRISHGLAIVRDKIKRFHSAADKFKSTVLEQLQGLIPVNGYWSQNEYSRFKGTIPIIKRAALEFRDSIQFPSKRKRFDKAVIEYCKQCEAINWHTALADVIYAEETKETQKEKMVCTEIVFT